MANEYYTPTGSPATGSQGSSATMRSEFELIEAALDLLPALSGNGNQFVVVNAGGTSLTVATASAARGLIELDTDDSPQFSTIELGHASDTTLSRSSAGIPAAEGVDLVTVSATQTLTNKTISASQITEISNLTAAEGAQLENIDSVSLPNQNWSWLGGLASAPLEDDDLAANGGTVPQNNVSETITNAWKFSNGLTLEDDFPNINFTKTSTTDDNFKLVMGSLGLSLQNTDDSQVFVSTHHSHAPGGGSAWGSPTGGIPSTAGHINAEGLLVDNNPVSVNSTTATHTAQQIELGHASDTTLSRNSAGDVAVEGNLMYRAGGTDVPIADGGTGASTASAARSALGLAIGTDVQAHDAALDDISGLAVTNGNIIVGDGTNWVAESGATARTSLGLGTADTPQFTGVEVGNASDTTLTRDAAGEVAVEGSRLERIVAQESFSIGGDFSSATGYARSVRGEGGNWIHVWIPVLSHSSGGSFDSNAGALPEAYRPSSNQGNVYFSDGTTINFCQIASNGTITTEYRVYDTGNLAIGETTSSQAISFPPYFVAD